MVLVSIILPVYNRAHSLRRAAQSVLGQTPRSLELIIVDDGSSDDSCNVAASLDDSRVRIVRHEVNRGAAAARNTGIRHASGSILAFQDSDDVWLPGKLEKQLRLLEEGPPELGAVSCGVYRWGQGQGRYISGPVGLDRKSFSWQLLRAPVTGTQRLMLRREVFDRCGLFDEEFRSLEEWDLTIRIAQVYEFGSCDEPLVLQEKGADSISKNPQLNADALSRLLDKHAALFAAHPRALAGHLATLAHLCCLSGDARMGRRAALRSLRLQPNQIKGWLVGGHSLLDHRTYMRLAALRDPSLRPLLQKGVPMQKVRVDE